MKTIMKILSLATLLLLGSMSKVDAQNTLRMSGPNNNGLQNVRGFSQNARYVVGQKASPAIEAFFWDLEGAANAQGQIPVVNMGGSFPHATANVNSEAFDVSNTGRVAGDFADPNLLVSDPDFGLTDVPIRSAGFWENGTWTGLGLGHSGVPTSLLAGSSAYAITSDGNMIAGFVRDQNSSARVYPHTWTYNETTQVWNGQKWAEPANVGQGSSIVTLSADGSIAAGWTSLGSGRSGILWTSPTEYTLLSDLIPGASDGNWGEIFRVSKNGRFLAFSYNEVGVTDGVTMGVYDRQENQVYWIPQARLVSGISDNGTATGSYFTSNDVQKGFVWDKSFGFMDYNEFRTAYFPTTVPMPHPTGLAPLLAGSLTMNNGISADGLTFLCHLLPANVNQRMAVAIRLAESLEIPNMPTNAQATVLRIDRNKVTFTWEAPATYTQPLTEFRVFRNDVQIATVEPTVLTYTDLDVAIGLQTYSVMAVYGTLVSPRASANAVTIVDNYDLPFFDDFETPGSFATNFWTTATTQGKSYWNADHQYLGVEGSGGVTMEMSGGNPAVSTALITKPLDATELTNVYLTYMIFAHYRRDNNGVLQHDTLFVDVSTDGTTWTNASRYVFPDLIDWKAEILDISSLAAGKLINVRFRFEGMNTSNNTKRYFMDNIGVSSTLPDGEAIPSGVITKTHQTKNSTMDIAWKSAEGIYGLTWQQTPVRYAFGNEGKPMVVAQSFDANELAIFDGLYLTSISAHIVQNIVSSTTPTELSLAVWVDGVRVVYQDIAEFTANKLNTFNLNTPVLLSTVQNNLKFGIEVTSHDVKELPLGADEANRAIAGKGDLYSYDGGTTWLKLSDLENPFEFSFHRNWAIVGNVSAQGATVEDRNQLILGYNVYRDGEKINDYLLFGQRFTTEPIEGCYTVRAFSLATLLSDASAPYCPYFITASAGENGTISPSGTITVESGTNQMFTITPNENYNISQVLIDGTNNADAVTNGSHTFTNVVANHSIAATFTLKTYTVTFDANGGTGTMNPQTFTHGVSQALNANTFTPPTDQFFNGWAYTATGNIVYANVAEFTTTTDVTLYAVWEDNPPIEYLITLSASPSEGGNVTGSNIYVAGTSVVATATPNANYNFVNWTESDEEVSTDATYTFTAESNRTLVANFALKTYTITVSAGANGTITPETITVNHGDDQVFTITPNEGFKISQVLIDGENNTTAVNNGTYTFTNVTANHSISAMFTEVSSILPSSKEMLSVYPNPVTDVLYIQTEETIKQIVVLNLTGRIVKTWQGNHRTVDLQSIPAGNYIVRIQTETAIIPVRIVKQ
jgi:hypothetical protein